MIGKSKIFLKLTAKEPGFQWDPGLLWFAEKSDRHERCAGRLL